MLIAGWALQPHAQGAQPTQRQPGLHGSENGAVQAAVATQLVEQVRFVADQNAQDDVRMPGEVLGAGVHHDRRAEVEGVL